MTQSKNLKSSTGTAGAVFKMGVVRLYYHPKSIDIGKILQRQISIQNAMFFQIKILQTISCLIDPLVRKSIQKENLFRLLIQLLKAIKI